MDGLKRIIGAFFDFLQGIVVVLAVLVMIYLFIMSPQEISGASMEPNFHNGEYILTNKVQTKFRAPQRGDVVVFKSPKNKEVDYIKRIIGLPGDTVKLSANKFYVNGQVVDEPYLPADIVVFGGSYLQEGAEIVVPPGTYFVSGDNRPHSSDSREFGPIAMEDFIGTVFFRYWPVSQMGVIPHPTYNIQ